jgi:hypothetical protein
MIDDDNNKVKLIINIETIWISSTRVNSSFLSNEKRKPREETMSRESYNNASSITRSLFK